MHIVVIGAGSIGCVLAAQLHRAGCQVTVIARGASLTRIRQAGIALSGAFGNYQADVRASETIDARPELALLTTQAMDVAAALRPHTAALGDVPVVALQNGFGGWEAAAELLPRSPLIGGLSLIAATRTAPGVAEVTTASTTWVGAVDPAHGEIAAHVAEVLGEAVPCELSDNIAGARWTKFLVNQINHLPAITGWSVQATIEHPVLQRILARGMREVAQTGLARQAPFASLVGITPDAVLRLATSSPASPEIALTLVRYLGATPNPGSTLQSIRRGVPTEIDFLGGALAKLAAGTGVATPVTDTLAELVRTVERGHPFYSPDEVAHAVGTVAPE